MYCLASATPNTVLGYSFWNGFEPEGRKFKLREISVVSFEKFEMWAHLQVFPTLEFASKEAARLNMLIKENCESPAELFALPLSVVSHQMSLWAKA